MQAITTIGLDIAKSVFQVHGIDAEGNVLIRRQLKRRYVLAFFQKLPPCLVGIEACATSHHWSRELKALGHNVRLMPPAYVKMSRGRLEAEVIVLRHQLNILRRQSPRRVRPNAFDRAIFVCLYRYFPDIGNARAQGIRPK